VIHSFHDTRTEKLSHGTFVRGFPADVSGPAERKLKSIMAATQLKDLNLPGNRLEKLKGAMSEYHSIRINQQWRIVFIWRSNAAHDVTVTDYH